MHHRNHHRPLPTIGNCLAAKLPFISWYIIAATYFRSTRRPNSRRDRMLIGGSLPPNVVGMEPFAAVETFARVTRFGGASPSLRSGSRLRAP